MFPHGQSPTGGRGGAGVVVSVTVVVVVVVVVVILGSGEEGCGGGVGGICGGSVPFSGLSPCSPEPAPQHQVPFLMVMSVK